MRDFIVNEQNNYKLKRIDEEDVDAIRNYIRIYKKDESITTEFYNRFKLQLTSIIAYGDTENVKPELLKAIIPKLNQNEYVCYVTPKPLIVMHEDVRSSWNCLLLKCGKPEYIIIYKDGK